MMPKEYRKVTAALLTTPKTWKQPKCPATDEWIKKMSYIYMYIYTMTITQISHEDR